MKLAPYFLIVADVVAFARKKGIPVGPGRGSAGGSLVAFALGITSIDPTSFRNRDENIDYLKEFRDQLGDIPVVVEFRHEEWMDENVFELLEDEDLGYVCVDEPQFKTLVPPVVRDTGAIGYVRFHGRNYKKWWQHKETHERYDYLYSGAELKEWVSWIKKLAAKTEKTFVSMNNHYRGQAVINGRMLREMLEEEWGEVR